MSRFHLTPRTIVYSFVWSLLSTTQISTTCLGQEIPDQIMRIEEDWEFVVVNPSPGSNTPEVCCVFGLDNPETGVHAIFELNHSMFPKFSAGGLQLQAWNADKLIGYRANDPRGQLEHQNETVAFTTVIELSRNRLEMSISKGSSKSFGTFGDSATYNVGLQVKTLENLNTFNPGHSVANSRVTFGANHVSRYARKAIRYYDANGTLIGQNTNSGAGWTIHSLYVAP